MRAMCYQIIILFYLSLLESTQAPTHLIVTRAGPCYGTAKTITSVSELSLATHTYDSMLSGELNISKNIRNGWRIKATMQKCVDIRNIDSCDFFRSFTVVKNGCSEEDEEEQETYNMLFHYATPKLKCPIRAGRYKIQNYPFFTEDNYMAVYEAKISTSVFGYTLRLDGFSVDHKKIFCLDVHLQLLYMRDHDWMENKKARKTTIGPPSNEEELNEK